MSLPDMIDSYWPVILTFFTASAAVGAQQVQIRNLEEAVQQQIVIQANQSSMRAQAMRLDERTLSIQRELEHQRETQQIQFRQLLDAINEKD